MTTKADNLSNPIAHFSRDKRLTLLRALNLVAGVLAAGCASTRIPEGVTPVTPFDVLRYQGTWYEIARLDHSFERGMSDVTATYIPQEDGSLRVINRGFVAEIGQWREAVGKAAFTSGANTGSLKVSFFGPFYAGYHVAAIDADYRWALIIGSNTGYAWILARDQTLTPSTQAAIVARASALGVDTGALIWVSQTRTDAPSAGHR